MSQVCYRPFIVSRHPLLGESAATRGRRAVVLAPGQLYLPLSECDPRVRCSPCSRTVVLPLQGPVGCLDPPGWQELSS